MSGILESTVEAMEKLGAERSGIVAAIGPLIRQHSYEVGGEFVERFVEERSIRDIAARLNRTEGAVKQLQLRAIQSLRTRIEGADV